MFSKPSVYIKQGTLKCEEAPLVFSLLIMDAHGLTNKDWDGFLKIMGRGSMM